MCNRTNSALSFVLIRIWAPSSFLHSDSLDLFISVLSWWYIWFLCIDWVKIAIIRAEPFMFFCSRKYIGNQCDSESTLYSNLRWFMLLTVLRRRSCCSSYFCVALSFVLRVVSCWFLACSLFWWSFFKSCLALNNIITSLGEELENWSICLSCICLFILHELLSVFFLSCLVSGVGCGLWMWHSVDFWFIFICNSSLYTDRVRELLCKPGPENNMGTQRDDFNTQRDEETVKPGRFSYWPF